MGLPVLSARVAPVPQAGRSAVVATSALGQGTKSVSSSGAASSRPLEERMWFYSHRSCSQDPAEKCNPGFRREIQQATAYALEHGFLASHIFNFTALPDYIMQDPRWERYLQPKTRGRGFWFWKAAILDHLLNDASTGMQDGDWVVYVDGDRFR